MWWHTLIASIGGVVALMLFLAPLPETLRARRGHSLGSINPLPLPLTACSTAGFVFYSLAIDNYLLFWPAACGLLAAVFCNLVAYAIAPRPTRDRMAALLLAGSTAFLVLGGVSAFANLSSRDARILWGWAANVAFVLFAAAPAATLVSVVRSRCSASLDVPLSVMNLANGALWLAYGVAIDDLFIVVPNAVGAALGLAYCLALLVFPRRPRSPPAVAAVEQAVPAVPSSEGKASSGKDVEIGPVRGA